MPDFDHVAVLLGAGASMDAGLPTSVHMTDKIVASLDGRSRSVQVLNYIRHMLEADAATRDRSGPVDVERLFTAVDLLIERYEQPWSPFVSTWSPGLESFSSPGHRFPLNLASDLQAVDQAIRAGASSRFGAPVSKVIADAITKAMRSLQTQDVSMLLKQVRQEMLASLFRVLYVNHESPVDYLTPLLELAEEQGSLTIATLNYDRTVEELAFRRGVDCDTGIETWLAEGQFAWKGREGLRLLKLHGSIDWVAAEAYEEGKLPFLKLTKLDEDSPAGFRASPAIVFGEGGKLRAEGPFLELLLTWSNQLQDANTLLVVGYSFRDSHVNEIVSRWFNDTPGRRIVLLSRSRSRGLEDAPLLQVLEHLGVGLAAEDSFPFIRVEATAAVGLSEAISRARNRTTVDSPS